MRRLAVVIVMLVGAMASLAQATTSAQLQTAINHVRADVSHLNDYATHKVKFLKVDWCRNLAKHARTLSQLSQPEDVPDAMWEPTMTMAREHELAGSACVRLQIPETNAHMAAAFTAVQQAQANDPTHRRFR